MNRPAPCASEVVDTTWVEKCLISRQIQATFPSSRRPVGDCRSRINLHGFPNDHSQGSLSHSNRDFFGAASAIALTPAFAALTSAEDRVSPIVMMSLVLLCGVLCFFAPSIRRAFGRGFLALGASVFALPISAFLLSGRAASEVVGTAEAGSEAFAAVGAGLAGIAVTGVATFFGLIIGTILLLIGLVLSLGGRREVIIVDGPQRTEPMVRK